MRLGSFICLGFLLLLVSCSSQENPNPAQLTAEESSWLQQNPDKLTLYFNTEFPPIEFISTSGEFTGMGADVIARLEQTLGISFKKQPEGDWNAHLAALRSGQCAIAPAIVRTAEREQYAFFTKPYATVPVVIITKHEVSQARSLSDLTGYRVGVVSGFATEQYMLDESLTHQFEVVAVEDVPEGLQAVAFGQLDAFVENLAVAAYYINELGIPNLRVAGTTEYNFAWSFGVSRQYPLLYSSLEKALGSIPEAELARIRSKWISLSATPGLAPGTIRLLKLSTLFIALLVSFLTVITLVQWRILRAKIEALRKSESKYGELVENANSLIVRLDREGRIAYINEYALDFFRLKAGEISGQSAIGTILPQVDSSEADELQALQNVIKHPECYLAAEYQYTRQDSSEVWVSWTNKPMFDKTGALSELLCVGIDVTAKKLVEAALLDAEAKYRSLIEHSQNIIFTITPSGMLTYMSPSGVKQLGYEPAEFIKADFHSFIHPDDVAVCEQALREVSETHAIKSGLEYRVLCKDGTYRWHRTTTAPVFDEQQHLISFVGNTEDVTEHKLAEETLRETTQQLEYYFNSALDLFCIANTNGSFLRLSRAWETALGFKLEELEHHQFLEFVHPDDVQATLDAVVKLRQHQDVVGFTNRYRCRDGSYRYIEWRSTAHDELIMAAARDITGRIQAEQELQRLNAQTFALNAELTAVNEKLLAQNVELGAANDELSATNDELVQAKEDLQENEIRLQTLFQHSPAWQILLNLETNRIVDVNDEYCRIFGYGRAESIGQTASEVGIYSEATMEQVLAELKTVGALKYAEVTIRTKSGGERIILASRELIYIQGVPHMLSMGVDITERKRAEEALHREKQFVDGIINSLPGTFFLYDADLRLRRWNHAHETALGYTSQELSGKFIGDWHTDPQQSNELVANLRHLLETGEGLRDQFETTLCHKDGRPIPFLIKSTVIHTVDGPVLIGVGLDITEQKVAKEALLQEKQFTEAILESLPGIFYVYDADLRLRRWNRTHEVDLGYTSAELDGKYIGEWHTDPKVRELGVASARAVLEQGVEGQIETTLLSKDGVHVPYIVISRQVDTSTGPVMIGIGLDITERKKTEAALREERQRLQATIEGTNAGTWEWHIQTGEIVANERWAQIIGYTLAELEPVSIKTWEQYTHPEDQQASDAMLARHFSGELDYYDIEVRMRHKAGHWVWIQDRGRVSVWSAEGQPLLMQGTHQDITERKQSEEALQQSEAFLGNTFDKSPMPQWVSDEHGTLIKINEACRELLHLAGEDLIGKYNILKDRYVAGQGFLPLIQAVYELGETANFILKWDSSEFQQLQFEQFVDLVLDVTVSPLLNSEGQVTNAVIQYIDITERVRTDAALRARESYLTSIIENQPGLVWLKDAQSRFLAVNNSFAQSCGISSPQFIIGKTDIDVWPRELAEKYREDDAKVMATGQAYMVEEPIVEQGETHWFQTFKTPVFNEQGEVIGTTGFAMDITQRKYSEDALRQQHELALALGSSEDLEQSLQICLDAALTSTESIGGGIYLVDSLDGSLVLVYHKGLSPDFVEAVRHIPAEDPRVSLLAAGNTIILNEENYLFRSPFIQEGLKCLIAVPIMHAGRMIACFNISSSNKDAFTAGDRTRIDSISAVAGSFIARNLMEKALREGEEQYRNVVESQSELIARFLENGTITFVNQAWQNYYQTHRGVAADVIGENVWRLMQFEDIPTVQRIISQLEPGSAIQDYEQSLTSQLGEIRWQAWQLYRLQTLPGQMAEYQIVGIDITERKQAEEALRESEERFRVTAEMTGQVIYDYDIEHSIISWSGAVEAVLGFTQAEMQHVGFDSLVESIHPEDRAQAVTLLEHAMHEHSTYTAEYRMRCKDGTYIYVHNRGAFLPAPQGKVQRMLGTIDDMTARRAAEEALRISEENYRGLFENAKEAILIAKDSKIVLCNPQMIQLLGLKQAAIINQPFVNFIHPEDRQLVHSRYQQRVRGEHPPSSYEFRVIGLNDRVRWVVINSVQFVWEDEPATLSFLVDITKRKLAEESLKEKAALLEAQMNATLDGLIVVDEKQQRILINQQAIDLLQVPPQILAVAEDELLLQHIAGLVREPEHFLADVKRLYQQVFQTSRDEIEFRSGLVLDRYTAPVLSPDGKCYGRIWTFRDITERKRAEQEKVQLQAQLHQAQKMESVGRLAGGVAHDFNNMLGVILGHTELSLENEDVPEPVMESLQEIRKAADRSANLTRQLLAFARKQPVTPKVIDLNETVAGVLKMLERLIGEDIDLAWLPGADLDPVRIDPSQIDQILANLYTNARDAIEGTGKITIETGKAAFDQEFCAQHSGYQPGSFILLAVSDNGCGMDEGTLSCLFEPFFTTKGMGQGTGLGLATVYAIVKQNDGFITVYSEVGQGTSFHVYLPRDIAKAEQYMDKPVIPAHTAGRETILLVEDEPAILQMTTKMLKRHGYSVLAAATPGEALDLARRHAGEIHLLVTDVIMPEMNGRELAKQLLSLYPGLKRLFMSGYTANVIAHHGVLEEGIHFIQKPYTTRELAVKIRIVLDQE